MLSALSDHMFFSSFTWLWISGFEDTFQISFHSSVSRCFSWSLVLEEFLLPVLTLQSWLHFLWIIISLRSYSFIQLLLSVSPLKIWVSGIFLHLSIFSPWHMFIYSFLNFFKKDFNYLLYFIDILGFELRTSHFLGRSLPLEPQH
jgi:hypothetical protein